MYSIEGSNIGVVWLQSIKTVLIGGDSISDDKGIIREVSPLYIHIYNPPPSDPIIEQFGDQEMVSFMAQNFTNPIPISDWGYSYAQRLYHGESGYSVSHIIKQLQRYPSTKSATLSLLQPESDTKHTPCLATLDFKIRQHTLYLNAFFRSQDIGKKFYADALQVLRLGKQMATELLVENVSLFFTICSAHIYETDIPQLQALLADFP